MALPSTSTQNRQPAPSKAEGFTLIELIMAIAVLSAILCIGLFVSFDFYKSYSFRSEKNVIASILQKARSQAMNNIDQTKHGVHFTSTPTQYIMFEGDNYKANDPDNIIINASYNIAISGAPFNIIFNQLSGTAVSPKNITVSDGALPYIISINSEGRIDW